MSRSRPTISRAALGALLLSLATPAVCLAQRLGGAPDAEPLPWLRVTLSLILCLGLAFGAALFMRKRLRGQAPQAQGAGRRLRLVETTRLSHQIDVCVLETDTEQLVVAASAQGATLLSRTNKVSAPETAP